MAPVLGGLWAEGDMKGVQRNFTAYARGSSILAVTLALAILILRHPLLEMFGPHFTSAAPTLAILLVGQVAGALAGSNALILSIAGHERTVASVSVGTLLLGMPATALLINTLGVPGAAAGAAATSILWNAILAARTRSLTALRPGVSVRLEHRNPP